MINNFLNFSSFEDFPKEIQDLVFQNCGFSSKIHLTKKAYYQNFIQAETDQKIGLYGENLVLKGMKLQEKLNSLDENFKNEFLIIENKFNPFDIEYCELLKIKNLKIDQCSILLKKNDDEILKNSSINPNWKYIVQGLFNQAMAHPEGYSNSSLVKLCYASNSASEAISQLNNLSILKKEKAALEIEQSEINSQFSKDVIHTQYLDFIAEKETEKEAINNSYKKKQEKILLKIANLPLMKNNENFIYEVSGGKSKFHDLKILVLDPNNAQKWSGDGSGNYIDRVEIEPGQSIMRGISKGRPFLAIKYSENDKKRISIFFQRSIYRPDDWFESGGGLLGEYNGSNGKYMTSLSDIMSKSNKHGMNAAKYYPMKIALKTLLTIGICQAPNKPTYKLLEQ